jgi:nucleoid-associated protein YgaU
MPVQPDSRFAHLPVLRVVAPDATTRQVIALRLERPQASSEMTRHSVKEGEEIDLLAQRFYGSERLWWRILDANTLVYPLDIKPGEVLNVPGPGPATRTTRARRF